ncbi:inorganic phosphate transporter [Prosthecobacter vanneervenii]|uniref:PiT family inorganic phosphate transporter n=1 Tax=Prosthecobacter vanneervenii TaxID=48466 RepID=A0A7W8DL56_9BACT|nr:inorganic phosphate transporter [Prosthecobacter vanneervenii]MBB5033948.1 PiT family inorganic phosphate transporter [Prosthecobacter vanneervenii]
MLFLITLAVIVVAYANGANANFKGVASLFGSGTTSYRTAVHWATITTFAGCVAAMYWTGGLLKTFTGKGLVPEALIAQPLFLLAVAAGAGVSGFLATWLGFPVSTTHLLTGALLGAGWIAGDVNVVTLWESFLKPLLISPLLALAGGMLVYGILKPLRLAPDHRTRTLDALHILSAGAVSFARGLNDTPKMAALLLGVGWLNGSAGMILVAVAMAAGGLISAGRVADTLAHKITDMNPGQGFAANLATALLVTTASISGLPVSTTHVSVGALLGIGIITRQAKWRTVIPVLAAWVITLPCAALMAGLLFAIGRLFV